MFSPRSQRIYFSDVVFADIFTSFAKVIGDVWLSTCMLLPGSSLLSQPSQEGMARWILPTLMRWIKLNVLFFCFSNLTLIVWVVSLPYAVRFRQCIIEYMLPTNQSKRPFYNAIKYASSFPVIYLSAAQRTVVTDLLSAKGPEAASEAWHGEHHLFRLWCVRFKPWWEDAHSFL